MLALLGNDHRLLAALAINAHGGHLIYRRAGSLRAVQSSLGHKKIESMVRYLAVRGR